MFLCCNFLTRVKIIQRTVCVGVSVYMEEGVEMYWEMSLKTWASIFNSICVLDCNVFNRADPENLVAMVIESKHDFLWSFNTQNTFAQINTVLILVGRSYYMGYSIYNTIIIFSFVIPHAHLKWFRAMLGFQDIVKGITIYCIFG